MTALLFQFRIIWGIKAAPNPPYPITNFIRR